MRGFEGWGRHLRSGPATAAKSTLALTHPSNLRETKVLTAVTIAPGDCLLPEVCESIKIDIKITVCAAAPELP